ncbi:MAG TPA: flagellar hook-associated protein FlgL [Acidimicrobiia bacterium]|nr:flagellar hook-associated protein FlgL [Acidimicrobiia bacterium]
MSSSAFRVTQQTLSVRALTSLENAMDRLSNLQGEMASGKQLQRPSDSPTGVVSALQYRAQIDRTTQYQTNADDGLSWLQLADSTLTAVNDQITAARSLALQGVSGASSQDSRNALAAQVDQIRNNLIDLANTKYLDRPIFAGTSASTLAYDASGAFLGDTNAVERNVGPGVTVQVNLTGPQAFGPPGADLFATLTTLADDLRTNPGAVNASDLGALDAASSRVRNAQGEVGARSAQLTTTKARSDDLLLNLRDSLSKIEDIDLPKAATDLQIQQVSYQAALAATARVIQPSLVDFLK